MERTKPGNLKLSVLKRQSELLGYREAASIDGLVLRLAREVDPKASDPRDHDPKEDCLEVDPKSIGCEAESNMIAPRCSNKKTWLGGFNWLQLPLS